MAPLSRLGEGFRSICLGEGFCSTWNVSHIVLPNFFISLSFQFLHSLMFLECP